VVLIKKKTLIVSLKASKVRFSNKLNGFLK
jgi:hypothetical protein